MLRVKPGSSPGKSAANAIPVRGSPGQAALSKVFPARSALTPFDESFLFGWRKRVTSTGMKIKGHCKEKNEDLSREAWLSLMLEFTRSLSGQSGDFGVGSSRSILVHFVQGREEPITVHSFPGFPVLRVCISRNPLWLCVLCRGGAGQNPPLSARALSSHSLIHSYLFFLCWASLLETAAPSSPFTLQIDVQVLESSSWRSRDGHTAPITQGISTCGVEPALHLQACSRLKNIPAHYASDFMAIKKLWDKSAGIFSGWMKAMLLKGLNQTFINRY